MSHVPNQESERIERIVAYLDGELSAEESARVEQQLATDEQFRQQLQGMQRTWDALDQLPVATVKDDFSRTTMEMVVATAKRDVSEKTLALPIQRRKRGLATALLAATAALLGMLAFRIVWQNPNRLLLADLAVIDNIDIYWQFQDVAFLDQLQQSLQGSKWPIGVDDEEIAADLERFQFASNATGRRQWLEQLSEEDRATLRAKFNRFRDLSVARQQELREMHVEVTGSADREEALVRYGRLLAEIPSSRQFQLRELPIDQRVQEIENRMRMQAAHDALELSTEEFAKLTEAMSKEVDQMMSDHERQQLQSLRGLERLRYRGEIVKRHMPQRGREFFDVLVSALPEGKRARFRELPPREMRDQVQRWVRRAIVEHATRRAGGNRQRFNEVTEQQLEQFFVELDPAEQQRLLAKPRDAMLRELQQRYRGRWRQDNWHRPREGFRPPGDRPGPPSDDRRMRDRRGEGPPFDRRGPRERPGRGGRRPPPPVEDQRPPI